MICGPEMGRIISILDWCLVCNMRSKLMDESIMVRSIIVTLLYDYIMMINMYVKSYKNMVDIGYYDSKYYFRLTVSADCYFPSFCYF